MEVRLARMDTMLGTGYMQLAELYASLGQLEDMKETLEGFVEDVSNLIDKLKAKLHLG